MLGRAYPSVLTAAGLATATLAIWLSIGLREEILGSIAWIGRNSGAIRDLAIAAGIAALGFGGWRVYVDWRRDRETKPDTDRLRQVTANFEGAVRMLAHDDPSVRLGAIYALERIARENAEQHWPIMETLTAYVRVWSVKAKRGEPAPVDIQAVFTVLGRREIGHEDRTRRLNLEGAYLVKARPDPASSRNFARAYLCGADLNGASLREADFREANLAQAKLEGAHLSRIDLSGADLEGAVLRETFLYRANLAGADLEGADLTKANLAHANLDGAWIRGVDLSTVDGLTQEQLDAAIGDAATKLPRGSKLTRPEHWVGSPDVEKKVVTLLASSRTGAAR
jgi:hypothetical protein